MNDRQLVRWYAKYNRLYFGGNLPENILIWYEVPAGAYGDCQIVDGVWRIRINPSLAGWPAIAKWTLIHEQAHIKLHPYVQHGKKFHTEMLRLAEAGAFHDVW
jgi:hypothetical protein